MSPSLTTAAVCQAVSDESLAKLRKTFQTVHYHPGGPIPADVRDQIEFAFGAGSIKDLESLDQLPKLKHIQLSSAGADGMLNSPIFKKYTSEQKGEEGPITLSTASGTHVLSIPNYIVGVLLAIYHRLDTQILIARNEQRWTNNPEVFGTRLNFARKTFGRTVGILGYGALGRETARLLKAHGMRIVAANTSGTASRDETYIVPGTGDKDGALPEKYYSTKDAASLEAFLRECDVLVATLPGTPQTKGMLDANKLALMKKDAVFINIGRGSLCPSPELLKALDSPTNPLFGAAIDVTDPEPLPQGHALFAHPRCIVTPHLSGETEGEFDIATDIAITNAERIRAGKSVVNKVNTTRGY